MVSKNKNNECRGEQERLDSQQKKSFYSEKYYFDFSSLFDLCNVFLKKVFLIESFKKYIHEKIRSLFNDSTKFVIFK
jgi:hypothetical protein